MERARAQPKRSVPAEQVAFIWPALLSLSSFQKAFLSFLALLRIDYTPAFSCKCATERYCAVLFDGVTCGTKTSQSHVVRLAPAAECTEPLHGSLYKVGYRLDHARGTAQAGLVDAWLSSSPFCTQDRVFATGKVRAALLKLLDAKVGLQVEEYTALEARLDKAQRGELWPYLVSSVRASIG